jgi:predicted transcriptional regulator
VEHNEISLHELQVYRALVAQKDTWVTVLDLTKKVEHVARRTITHHLQRFLTLGLVDRAETFPGHRYRWAAKGDKRNRAYMLRLQRANEAFGANIEELKFFRKGKSVA